MGYRLQGLTYNFLAEIENADVGIDIVNFAPLPGSPLGYCPTVDFIIFLIKKQPKSSAFSCGETLMEKFWLVNLQVCQLRCLRKNNLTHPLLSEVQSNLSNFFPVLQRVVEKVVEKLLEQESAITSKPWHH